MQRGDVFHSLLCKLPKTVFLRGSDKTLEWTVRGGKGCRGQPSESSYDLPGMGWPRTCRITQSEAIHAPRLKSSLIILSFPLTESENFRAAWDLKDCASKSPFLRVKELNHKGTVIVQGLSVQGQGGRLGIQLRCLLHGIVQPCEIEKRPWITWSACNFKGVLVKASGLEMVSTPPLLLLALNMKKGNY